jgi:D-3-phosphoglycerate dehydrogenase
LICYLDCSPFMKSFLDEEKSSANTALRIHVGDPAAKDIVSIIGNARVLLNGHTTISAEIMAACPALRSIVFLGTGASNYIDLASAKARGIHVATIKSYGDRTIAEHAFALMLAAARNISRMDRDVRHGIWEAREGIELGGRTLGIIGAGSVGRMLASMARDFGMKVLIWNRSEVPDEFVTMQSELDEVLSKADVLSIHLALTEETNGFLGAAKLARTKPGVIIVNTARGALIDETALLYALESGQVSHAALDVFGEEPLPPDSPFCSLDNVTLTSHAAFKSKEAAKRLLRQSLDIAFAQLDAHEGTRFSAISSGVRSASRPRE